MGQRSSLGRAIETARKAQRLTQAKLAKRSRLSIAAIRNLERGLGRVSTLNLVLRKLKLELRGRTLLAGPVGRGLAAARMKRRLSRRALARALHVSRNTLAATEAGGGLVQTLEAYAGAVAAALYLSPKGAARPFYPHVGTASVIQTWETPRALAKTLSDCAGGFDLDPCAATHNRRKAAVKAKILLTESDDGLSAPWRGKVFVNPPYGRPLQKWVEKCRDEAASGRAVVIGLVPVRSEARWWHKFVEPYAEVFLMRPRLRFSESKRGAPFPSALVVWGGDAALILKLKNSLDAWHISKSEKRAA